MGSQKASGREPAEYVRLARDIYLRDVVATPHKTKSTCTFEFDNGGTGVTTECDPNERYHE